MAEDKRYIGDAVYVKDNGHMLTLTTEDGISVLNIVHMEPEVIRAFVQFARERGFLPEKV